MSTVISTARTRAGPGEGQDARRQRRQAWWWMLIAGKPLGAVAAAGILLLVLLAVAGPLLAPYPYEELHSETLRGPSAKYWFGTDRFGRDLFSRVLQGTRIALVIGFLA